MDSCGNGLLMAPVNLTVLNTLAIRDYFGLCKLLAYKNEINGSNFFHYHANKVIGPDRRTSLKILFWLSEMWKRLPIEVLPEVASPPDVNLMNKMLKTPLQEAIERDNPGAATLLF